MAKECMLSTGKLSLGGLPDMTSAVYSGRNQLLFGFFSEKNDLYAESIHRLGWIRRS